MSKKQDREEREIERLYKTNRELKAEVRRLQKLCKKLDRGFKRTINATEEYENIPEEVQKLCFQCGGEFKKIEVLGRSWRCCQDCGRRSSTKVIDEKAN